jgi:hypothetical protein
MRRHVPLTIFVLVVLAVCGITTASAAAGPIGFSGSDPIDFGDQPVGTTSSPATVTITNTGTDQLAIDGVDGVTIGGANPGSFQASNDGCSGQTVAAGGTCTVDVSFAPVNGAGSYSASLDVQDTADGVSGSTGLAGNGTGSASVLVSPDPFDFGDLKVGSPAASHQFTVKNTGNLLLSIPDGGVSVTGSGFSKGSDGCNNTLVIIGGSCTFTVLFDPGSAGSKSGLASITSNDPNSPAGVSLSGNGTVPVASLPDSVSFASPIGIQQQKIVTLTNTGDAPLVISGLVGLSGDPEFAKDTVTPSNCGDHTLAAHGGSCDMVIDFTPSDTASKSATLTFNDDASPSPQTVQLTGTALIPGINSDPTSMDFENLPVGRLSLPSATTITNTGQANLHIALITIGGTNFKNFRLGKQTCTQAPIPHGETCVINVRFAPTAVGARVASLRIQNDAGGAPNTLNVTLTGTGVNPASVTALRAAAGCTDARLTWRNPDATGFLRVRIVRNPAHSPRGPFDGVVIKHTSATAVTNTGLDQFRRYYYALYAVYMSFDRSHLVYSAPSDAAIRTGRICTPRNGSLISDLSPDVDWTSYRGAHYYAYILQRLGHTILVRYPKHSQTTIPSSWKFDGQSKSIQHGGVYSFYLYAYTSGRPKGFLIGQTVFTER